MQTEGYISGSVQASDGPVSSNLAVNGKGWKGLLLIDTRGLPPADRNELREPKGSLAVRPGIGTHPALRGDACSADMLLATRIAREGWAAVRIAAAPGGVKFAQVRL